MSITPNGSISVGLGGHASRRWTQSFRSCKSSGCEKGRSGTRIDSRIFLPAGSRPTASSRSKWSATAAVNHFASESWRKSLAKPRVNRSSIFWLGDSNRPCDQAGKVTDLISKRKAYTAAQKPHCTSCQPSMEPVRSAAHLAHVITSGDEAEVHRCQRWMLLVDCITQIRLCALVELIEGPFFNPLPIFPRMGL